MKHVQLPAGRGEVLPMDLLDDDPRLPHRSAAGIWLARAGAPALVNPRAELAATCLRATKRFPETYLQRLQVFDELPSSCRS
jgi:hypothetical protein